MNPLLVRPEEDAFGGLLAGMTPKEAGDLAKPGVEYAGGLLDNIASSASSIAEKAPGSLGRAWHDSKVRSMAQDALNTASYYAGPHLSDRAAAIPAAAAAATENMFGNKDAREASAAFKEGHTAQGAKLLGLGSASALLDVPTLGTGSGMARGLLRGLTRAAHYTPDLSTAILPAAARLSSYADPPASRIADWQWKKLPEVAQGLGLTETPAHVEKFGDFMLGQANKAAGPGLTPRDLIKAYTTTRASIQRGAVDTQKIRDLGLPVSTTEAKVRPEGAFSDWLLTPDGQRYLNAAERGTVDPDAIASAQHVMRPFGKADKDLPQALSWAAENLPGREAEGSRLVAAGLEGKSTRADWRDYTKDVYGIGPSKSGFFASLLGRGDAPTLDARQVILHTGQPTKEASRYIARGGGEGGAEAVERLAARQQALDVPIREDLRPMYQHLTHHSVWDKAGNEVTTHADVVRAMQLAALGLGVGVPATMAMQPGLFPLPQQQ